MRIVLSLMTLALLLAPTASAQLAGDRLESTTIDTEALVPAEGPFVRLHTGEVIRGEVSVTPQRGVPDFVVVGDESIVNFRVHSFRVDEDVHAFASVGLPKPLLVVREVDGAISVYRPTGSDALGVDFFRMGDGQLRIASPANLRDAVGDHPDALRHLQRDRTLSYVGMGAVAFGTGLVLTGAAVQFGDLDAPASGVIIATSGVVFAALVNAFVPSARQRARRAAIDAYNQ